MKQLRPKSLARIEELYAEHCAGPTGMAAHLPRLRELATSLPLAVEFGVNKGGSSSALILGAEHVISYDLRETSRARSLERAAGEWWEYRLQDSRTACFPPPDLLFVDSLHTYSQCRAELDAHANRVKRYLVFHDVITFGVIGADGEAGDHLWEYEVGASVPPEALGIRPAIDELMVRDPSWRILASYTDSHGLLVLERRR